MKGRKPKSDAIRRKLGDAYALQESAGNAVGVTMPDDIRKDPVQSEIWAYLVPTVNNFTEQDIPNLRLLCFWHATAAQAQQVMQGEGGKINIFDKVGVKPFKTKDGHEIPIVKPNPAAAILKQASAEIRALSDHMGLSPLARSRIGLMDATTTKTAADMAARFTSIREAYGLPEAEIIDVQDADQL